MARRRRRHQFAIIFPNMDLIFHFPKQVELNSLTKQNHLKIGK